jgi:Xaa-Pro aminopeptidase
MDEITSKLVQVRDLTVRHNLDGVLLQRVSSLAWMTCGASTYVNTAQTEAEAVLLITPEDRHLFTNNIEATRLEKEAGLADQGWVFHIAPWFETNAALQELTAGLRLGADGLFPGACDLSDEIAHLRADLSPEEGDRFLNLGHLCASAMDTAARAVCPGQTEYEIAGLLAGEAEKRGVQATVNLIATDERIFNFRHPLPTAKKLEHYVMLILCGRRHGLICSVTRFVYFGHLQEQIRRKAEAVAHIDAAMIAATRPGRSLGQIFQVAVDAYGEAGYPGEWRLHHQGGLAGYEPRENIAKPGSTELVKVGQVYAWNPSITGAKSEDTILVGEQSNEIITEMADWPFLEIQVAGEKIRRPAILEKG